MKKEQKIDQSINILDVVALLKEVSESKLVKGQVGTVVEELGDNAYEIEFADKIGKTNITLALHQKNLVVLHFEGQPELDQV